MTSPKRGTLAEVFLTEEKLKEQRSDAAAALGSIRTPKKAVSSASNIAAHRDAYNATRKKDLCPCGNCKTCISREYQRQRRAKLNQKGELKMITVTYTEAKTVKGEFKNLYKSRKFRDLSDATDFYNKLVDKPNITDVRIVR